MISDLAYCHVSAFHNFDLWREIKEVQRITGRPEHDMNVSHGIHCVDI